MKLPLCADGVSCTASRGSRRRSAGGDVETQAAQLSTSFRLRWATVIFLSLKIDAATARTGLGSDNATGDAFTVIFARTVDRVTGFGGAGSAIGFGLGVGATGMTGGTMIGGLATGVGLEAGGLVVGGVVGGASSWVRTWVRDGIGAEPVDVKDCVSGAPAIAEEAGAARLVL